MPSFQDFEFRSSTAVNTIHARKCVPDGTPRAVVQIVHGIAEHIERYDDFMRFLAENGIVAVGEDHLGHGKSVTQEEDLGFFSDANRESGTGRPDLVLTEQKFMGRAIILELKVSESFRGMEQKCEEALAQIEAGNYAQPLEEDGCQEILKYAVCFFKKGCMVKKG